MAKLHTLCVYCGSSTGNDPVFGTAAREFGRQIAARGMSLVYGGGHVGLMGVIADAVLDAGGAVTGVIPTALMDAEVGHERLTELRVVRDMHERKAVMADLADGFIALPGGIGTLEELFEVMTWLQLGYHAKPVGLLNVCGFYDELLAFLDKQRDTAFLRREHRSLLLTADDPEALLDQMLAFEMPSGVSVFDRLKAGMLVP